MLFVYGVFRYTVLDAVRLVSFDDDCFHCERCNAELVVETDKLAAQEMGDGDDNVRRCHHEKLKVLIQMMEVELKPLAHQLNIVKDLEVPEFGTLQAWEVRANVVARAAMGDCSTDSRSAQGLGCNRTLMPFVGDAKVEVAFLGVEEKGENIKTKHTPLKVLPPWMIKQGMNLTQEQRGIVKQELKTEGTSTTPTTDIKDEKLIGQEDVAKDVQDEYIKAYYAALLQRQQELEATKNEQHKATNPERQTGMKMKRKDHQDVNWEEDDLSLGKGLHEDDLKIEGDYSKGDEEEDDIDREEG